MQVFTTAEAAAALFQATITFGLAFLFGFLYRQSRKAHFLWWSVAFGLYGLGLGAIVSFLLTATWAFLYAHQVIVGWTALALLYAALVFERQLPWRPQHLWFLVFPVIWAYFAIFGLDNFALAAGTTVVLLSVTTVWTGWVFWRYRAGTGSSAALFLAITLGLWALHHLDYPFLRARGAWNPWGYFVDALFVLATGIGILLLVLEEFQEGLKTLAALSADLGPGSSESLGTLLQRPLGLRGVRGAGVLRAGPSGPEFVRGSGVAERWGDQLPSRVVAVAASVFGTGDSVLEGRPGADPAAPAFLAGIPLGVVGGLPMALVVAGDVAAAFAVLDQSILAAVGAQIGAGLHKAELSRALEQRRLELERLSVRMIQQHEEQRRRIGRELHDETAQVFSALKMQLGSVREVVPEALAPRFDRLLELVDIGSGSIRNVAEDLRPALLDDLGLIPALGALVADFQEWSGVAVDLVIQDGAPPRAGPAAELAMFRAVQEGLANVARHAQAATVRVSLSRREGIICLTIDDDGIGMAPAEFNHPGGRPGRSGLFGMQKRIEILGGRVALAARLPSGLSLAIELPEVP